MRAPYSSWTIWSIAILLSPANAFHIPLHARQLDATAFNWSSITPTPDLQYHPCYGNFQCARLRVPLDWSKSTTNSSTTTDSEGPFAAIAIVTLPAAVPVTDPSYAGPVLINPGGPGGSGTAMALSLGATMQGLLDISGVRHYDIVGFDPRGMALTTPSASCYASQFDRAVGEMALRGMPSVLTEQGLRMRFEMHRGLGEMCDPGVFRHLSTASVARDMLEIVDRSHELLVKTKTAAGGNSTVTRKACGGGAGGKPRLQYMGFSYGTLLGNTFASMFPGRVGRMMLDGVVDADDYMSGTWAENVNDAEAAVDAFYRTCFDSGAACPLRQDGDASSADIRARVDALLATLRDSPVSTIHNNRIYVVTSYLVSQKFRTSLYEPIANYESLAVSLAEALAGNFSAILSDAAVMGPDLRSDVCAESPATGSESSSPQDYNHVNEAARGVICGDSHAAAGTRDLAWAGRTVARITGQSGTTGEGWTNVPLGCAGWPFDQAYTFPGPFGSPAPGNSSDIPAAPLLLLSTKTDHATPLGNAYTLSRLHQGSSVAVVDAVGHCALLATVSACVYGIVQEYFHTGKVPANGTVCQADCVPNIPFQACPGLPGISG